MGDRAGKLKNGVGGVCQCRLDIKESLSEGRTKWPDSSENMKRCVYTWSREKEGGEMQLRRHARHCTYGCGLSLQHTRVLASTRVAYGWWKS